MDGRGGGPGATHVQGDGGEGNSCEERFALTVKGGIMLQSTNIFLPSVT